MSGAHVSRMNVTAFLLAGLVSLLSPAVTPVYGPPPEPGTALWFGLTWIDTSTEGAINGIRADETARIEMVEDHVAQALEQRGFALEDAPVLEISPIKDPVTSNGRDVRLAREMGMRYAISGQVQKVSNLIIAVNLYVRDAETGENVRAGAVDIRGNNDDSFRRGYDYLLKNIIFREEDTE